MIDLTKLQYDVWTNTKRLGYLITKKTTLKKLKEEIKEFKKAKPVRWDKSLKLSMFKSDKQFLHAFENDIKGTEHDEIPDKFFVLLSYCEENNIDFSILVANKLRYNKLRD